MIATVALGYADGIARALSGRGAGAIGEVRAPIAGRVSMDLLTLDVTALSGISVGDTVEIFGETISLDEIAAEAGTNAYEILTGIGPRVPRHYSEGAQ